jgi:hypothetical protein
MMKLRRYNASGRIHRKGMTATSWQILFVVASSRMEAQAGSKSQRRGARGEVRGAKELEDRESAVAEGMVDERVMKDGESNAESFEPEGP